MLLHCTFATSFGPFSVAVDKAGRVIATAFGDLDALLPRCPADVKLQSDDTHTAAARAQITAYLEGGRRGFDLPLAPGGTAFQQRVWTALRAIPRGETSSYGALAALLRTSARAVGRANATNPICLLIPCHRVIGADGSLTGFAFGEALKRRLLALEGAPVR